MSLRLACIAFVLSPLLGAQEPAQPQTKAGADQPQDTAAAIEAWLTSSQTKKDEPLLNKAVAAILKEGEPGLQRLARIIAERPQGETPDEAEKKRTSGLNSVLRMTCLGFWEREVRSNVVYAGQFDALKVLQPHAGKLFLGLILEPPAWFPTQRRDQVVRVVRDLFPTGPAPEQKTKLLEIAKDEDFEPDRLRSELAYALAQWGDRSLVDKRIQALEAKIAAGAEGAKASLVEDRVRAQHELAEVYYQMRDYAKSAELYTAYLRAAEQHKLNPAPNDYYNCACNLSLAGDVDGALAELERCFAAVSGDPTARDNFRRMMETDMDLKNARASSRYQAIKEAAAGAREKGEAEDAKGKVEKSDKQQPPAK
jgi:tetratricopeptide (TPR) repeat protein